MTAKELIRKAFDGSDRIMQTYLQGLSKADLLMRPVPGMNHIAWQLGHLISGERRMMEMIRPGSSPPLPDGFEATYHRDNTKDDDASKYLSPEEYLKLWKTQREATLALLDSLPDEELDKEEAAGGKLPPMAPTVGQLIHLAGTHPILHAGQFVAVRRALNLPIAL
jgi:hypothetical protein